MRHRDFTLALATLAFHASLLGGCASSHDATSAKSSNQSGAADSGPGPAPSTAFGAGWLYTQGSRIYVADGNGGGAPWMGRGVNLDDVFFCGYNGTLSMDSPGITFATLASNLIVRWQPNFLRVSLAMATNPTTVSWLRDEASYRKPMVDAIHAMGKHSGVYVLVTVRSDKSMIGQDQEHGDPEATGIPSDGTTTPDASAFPRGTDPVYEALVDDFANDAFVLFGLTNEPGGNLLTNDRIRQAMDHAVLTIRAEEDKLGAPHHLVAVQGNDWTSNIGFYAQAPLARDNVVYEAHGYPPTPAGYTYANLPVIIGEYGSLDATTAPAFFADVEQKQIPSLAWDFEPYSNCAPDLVEVDKSPANLTPTAWGTLVENYLAAHAPQ